MAGASAVVHASITGTGWMSRASQSNERWVMDVTHILCGQDGWAHLAAVIDCHDRELIGYEFALRRRAKEAERARWPVSSGSVRYARRAHRSYAANHGLIFQNRRFPAGLPGLSPAAGMHHPCTPEQNGIIERFFRCLKEECV